YVEDKVDKGWCIPVHMKPRDLYDMGDAEGNTLSEADVFATQELSSFDATNSISLSRPGVVAELDD
ncbi:hypothetical protein LINGRAPRIM_LOCUS3247, partial [Linum grandiflorum]